MKIVVLDGFTLNPGDNPWTDVEALGPTEVYDRTPPPEIVARAREAEIVLTNKTLLDRRILEELPGLRFIGVLATGFNVVDVQAARERSIPVSNVPEYGTDSVAQHVFALILELTNRVALHDGAVRAGEWASCPDFCFWKTPTSELAGKTMSIIGFGRIGRRVGEIAHAFGMAVRAYDPAQADPPAYTPFDWSDLDETFVVGDIVSLNCPLTPENEGMVDSDRLRSMKPGAILINASRGPLVREKDLAAALKSGGIAGAGVDVASHEPLPADSPLITAPNCIITPHIAWASLESRRRLMATTVDNIRPFLAGSPQTVVN